MMAACWVCTCIRVVWVTNTVSRNIVFVIIIVFHRPGRFGSRLSFTRPHNARGNGVGVRCKRLFPSFVLRNNRFFSSLVSPAFTRHEHTHRSVSDSRTHDSRHVRGPRSSRAGGPGRPGGGRVWSVVGACVVCNFCLACCLVLEPKVTLALTLILKSSRAPHVMNPLLACHNRTITWWTSASAAGAMGVEVANPWEAGAAGNRSRAT